MAERLPLGAVLLGGRSRRLGRDKAWVEWRGEALARRAVRSLGEVVPEVIGVGGSSVEYGSLGVPVVADDSPGLGPLGGLATALARSGGRGVVLLACDLPRVEADLLRLLVETARLDETESVAWIPRVGDSLQPLCAVYAAAAGPPLAAFLAAGERRAHGFVASVETEIVEIDSGHSLYRPDLLANVNTPEDLARLRATRPNGEGTAR